jgi:hypothetical protein
MFDHTQLQTPPGSLERLRAEGFSPEVVDAVDHLTKHEAEQNDYPAFVQRAAANPIARQVKLADIQDNLDVTRLPRVTERDAVRLNHYLEALEWLKQCPD